VIFEKDIFDTVKIFYQCLKEIYTDEILTVPDWATKNRVLSVETSAEPGAWKNERTPYLTEPMTAFTDPAVRKITVVASSQVGKTEALLNMFGFVIDQQPGAIVWAFPNVDAGRDFSVRRLMPMISATKNLAKKLRDGTQNTTLKKHFTGCMLSIVGSNSASSLASIPARYIFCDEVDRFSSSAENEGSPIKLLEARTSTFYDSKMVLVSTPTQKGFSTIEKSFYEGSMERWCYKCKHCGEYHPIFFRNVKFDTVTKEISGKTKEIPANIYYACENCGCIMTEQEVKKSPAKWIAENPTEIKHRSFWLNGFSSPWLSWDNIIQKFLLAKGDINELRTVYNTLFGETFEERPEVVDVTNILARRVDYGAVLHNDILFLTCGVDVQGDRLEYEIVGFGKLNQVYGVKYGQIFGDTQIPDTWEELEKITDKYYADKNGRALKVSVTFVDSGFLTANVYAEVSKRLHKKWFCVKGVSGSNTPQTHIVSIKKTSCNIGNKNILIWLAKINSDVAKLEIYTKLKIQNRGSAGYYHFPIDESAGYNLQYFEGLNSETMVRDAKKGWFWKKIHTRNEPLDLRNYALAAFKSCKIDLDLFDTKQYKSFNNSVQNYEKSVGGCGRCETVSAITQPVKSFLNSKYSEL
jgi:phage terminase large subunit GpA-like protein